MQCPQTKANSEKRPPRGGGGTWVNVCSRLRKSIFLSLPHYSLFFGLLQTPSQSLFGKCNFRDPNLVNFYLYIYLINVVSSGGMKCGQCELIVKVNKQQLSDFLTENLPILNPYLPQKSENLRPHSSKSIENATPLQSLQS